MPGGSSPPGWLGLKEVPSLSVAAFVCFFWDFIHSSYIEHAAGRRFDFLVLRDLLIFSQVSSTYLECITSLETPLKTFGKYSFLATPLPVNIRCIEYNEIIMSLVEYFPLCQKDYYKNRQRYN